MAKRIIELSKTTNTTVDDDYIMIDGVSKGVRKILLKDVIPEKIDMNIFKEIEMTMPKPGTMQENTENLQRCLNVAKETGLNIRIKFRPGTYELTTCVIYSNTHIILSNGTYLKHVMTTYRNPAAGTNVNIPMLFVNAKPFDVEDSNITGYNGHSNIHFEGGTIEAFTPFLFCHGMNITVENVCMPKTKYYHYIQVAACKNFLLKNSQFLL